MPLRLRPLTDPRQGGLIAVGSARGRYLGGVALPYTAMIGAGGIVINVVLVAAIVVALLLVAMSVRRLEERAGGRTAHPTPAN